MSALLVEGRRAANGSYYVHSGDLKWWLYYPSSKFDWSKTIFLWEEPGEELQAWVYLSLDWRTFDLFVRPDLLGSLEHDDLLGWAEVQLGRLLRDRNGVEIRTMWVLEDDRVMVSLLERRGFTRIEGYMDYLERSLIGSLPARSLPVGFVVRPVAGEFEVGRRASASHAAFSSRLPFEAYRLRYLDFMRSPAYDLERDLVVVAPDGSFAAFCIFWLDSANRVGLFEPVGTHPDFQRKGLGGAVMAAGLHRLQVEGMRSAIVVAEHDNPAALRLYESLGFRVTNRFRTYVKPIGCVAHGNGSF
jgi:ribosomal protein S18 acetylase RimI-like enzyme